MAPEPNVRNWAKATKPRATEIGWLAAVCLLLIALTPIGVENEAPTAVKHIRRMFTPPSCRLRVYKFQQIDRCLSIDRVAGHFDASARSKHPDPKKRIRRTAQYPHGSPLPLPIDG
jgi:hypothetical protein